MNPLNRNLCRIRGDKTNSFGKGAVQWTADSFIIHVYCVVVETYKMVKAQYKIRRGGFNPALTDQELLTLEICEVYFKLHSDKDLFDYFQSHYKHFFPNLRDRPSFVRQAANLWQVKTHIWQFLIRRSGQAADSIQVIDTRPLPVCTYTRSKRDRCFKTEADYGHCAAKKLDYDGFKLGLRVSQAGMITHFPLLNARAHDVNHTNALIEGFSGLCPADKGFRCPVSPTAFVQPLRRENRHAGKIEHDRATPESLAKVLLTDS